MNTVINSMTWQKYQQLILPGLRTFDHSFWDDLQLTNYAFSFENHLVNLSHHLNGMVLLGKHDAVVGYHDQKKFFCSFPKVKTAIINRAGHNLFIDRPSQVKAFSKNFLVYL